MQINASVVLIECSDRNIAPHPKIVAIGSSTTAGEGNIRACPGRLLCFLRDEYPNAAITLANKGIGGQEAPVELQRFDTDVIAEKSDLVIWQIGTTRPSAMDSSGCARRRQGAVIGSRERRLGRLA